MKNYSMKNTGILSLTLSMFIFGTIGIFVRYISLPSGFLAMSRGILGTLFLLAVVFIRKNRLSKEAIKNNLVVLILSGAFIGINWILLFEAYKYTTVACATLCYYLSPVFVIIASIFVLSEKLTAKKILCVISALAGIVLVSGVLESDLGDIRGILLGIGAAVFYASVVLLNKKLKNISSYDTTVIQLSSAAVVILPYTLICEDISLKAFDMKAIIMLIIVGTVHTGLSYMLYFSSLKQLSAQTAAIFSYIDPVVAILLSALLLKEELSTAGIIGAVLILGATLICELPARKKFQ